MQQTIISCSNKMTLQQVIARLGKHEVVNGILIIGSASEEKLTPYSDYDLVLVLSDMPAPLHVGLTYIDQRLTDIIFVTVEEIEQILAVNDPANAETWVGRTIRWLQEGRVAFDRSGRLQRAQQKVRTGRWLSSTTESEIYRAWFRINYNFQQNKRMLASSDPTYQMALDVRLLYSLSEIFVGYFQFRGLLWKGEKECIRYLAAHDSAYLELFKQCLAEADRECKFQLYERLAMITTAPVEGLWEDEATAIDFKPGTELEPCMIKDALAFWESLITD